jgi:hypothetical protein
VVCALLMEGLPSKSDIDVVPMSVSAGYVYRTPIALDVINVGPYVKHQ